MAYKEIVTSPSPQLENPMSIPLAIPVSDIFCNDVRMSISIRDLPVTRRYTIRIENDIINLTIKWHSTMNSGNLNSYREKMEKHRFSSFDSAEYLSL